MNAETAARDIAERPDIAGHAPPLPAGTARLPALARKAGVQPSPARSLWTLLMARTRDALIREQARGTGFVTLPVLFGAGAAVNFSLARDPQWITVGLIALASAGAMWGLRSRPILGALAAASLVFSLGLLAASFQILQAGTKMLGSEVTTRITGRIVSFEDRADARPRVTIDLVTTERPRLRYAPQRVRVTARELPPGLHAGATVSGVVRLLPPTGPVRPYSYDFSFQSYFDGVGASGFFLSGPALEAGPGDVGWRNGLTNWVENARQRLAAHIRGRVTGPEGEIAAALVAGVRGGIPEADNEALRTTGLAHILSISGLHMALVAGVMLGATRTLFALFPGFASRYPVKKYAAAVALAAITVYLAISGAEVAAERSYVMFAVMLTAVLFDRAALTMRNLAISALIVLAIAPHEVMGPSFQMSFAATAALIAGFGWFAARRCSDDAGAMRERVLPVRLFSGAALFLGGLAMTSLIAGSASGLFGAYHFQRVAPLGLVANLLAGPIVTFAVMPSAVAGTLLTPFGLDWPFFYVMGEGLSAMLAIARWLAERSPIDAVGIIPPAAVGVLSVALAIATVATTWLRAAAMPFLVAGVLLIADRDMPDVLLSEDGTLAALVLPDGRLAVSRPRAPKFTTENWARAVSAETIARAAKGNLPPGGRAQGFFCSEGLCLARDASGRVVAVAANEQAAGGACPSASVILIQDATASNPCPDKSRPLVVTKRDLALRGSAEIRFLPSGDALAEFAVGEGERPWHRQRRYSREARGLPPYQRRTPDGKAQPPATPGAISSGGSDLPAGPAP